MPDRHGGDDSRRGGHRQPLHRRRQRARHPALRGARGLHDSRVAGQDRALAEGGGVARPPPLGGKIRRGGEGPRGAEAVGRFGFCPLFGKECTAARPTAAYAGLEGDPMKTNIGSYDEAVRFVGGCLIGLWGVRAESWWVLLGLIPVL